MSEVLLTLPIFESDTPTLNGRIYPKKLLEQIIEDASKNSFPVMGEFAYDVKPNSNTVDLASVSHFIKNLRIENNYLVGDISVLKTPNGLVLNDILKQEAEISRACSFEAAPRGHGKVDENGIVSDYSLVAIDIVAGTSSND